jgi:UDP-glucose 4-epimerase
VDAPVERGHNAILVDDLSSGSMENLGRWRGHPNFKFVRVDLSKGVPDIGHVDVVRHLVANPR